VPEHPNTQRAREAYEAFGRGDLAPLVEIFADDIVLHTFGSSPLAGDYKGKDAIIAFLAKLFEMTDGTFTINVHAVTAHDDRAVALAHMTAKRGDRTLDLNSVHVFRLADGLITEMWSYEDDQDAADAFWS